MLKSAVLKAPVIADSDNDIDELWRSDIHEDYVLKNEICLAQLETPIRAGFHIVNVLDGVLKLGKINKLYKKLISGEDTPKEDYSSLVTSIPHSKQHYAQMTSEFPLADKQRNALHFLSELKDGHFLAVNGPPGTGKTTLLRSVVANLWVEAALNKKEPPIIAAVSSNNQAVTNIIECFTKVEESNIEEILKGRWLPEFSTYGLFACGSNKSNDKNLYPYITKQGAGIMAKMDNEEYIKSAKIFFLRAFNKWHLAPDEAITCIDKAASILLTELKKHDQLKTNLIENIEKINLLIEKINHTYGSEHDLNGWIKKKSGVLTKNNIQVWKENTSERESLYILAPDLNKLEIHASSLLDRFEHIRNPPYDRLTFNDEGAGAKRNAEKTSSGALASS